MNRHLLLLALILFSMPAAIARTEPADRLAGSGLLLLGNNDEELSCRVNEALDAYHREGDRQHEAICRLVLGLTEMKRNHADVARVELTAAATGLEQAGDRFGAWMARWTLADFERREGQFDVSIEQHEHALALIREAASSPGGLSIETFKTLGAFFGASPEMLGPLGSMPEIVKPFLLAFAESLSRDAFAAVLIEVSRLDRADAELTRALQAGAIFGGLFDSSIHAHFGDLRRRQWRFDEAKESYLKALEGAKLMPALALRDEWVEVNILGQLAEIELLRGRTDDALGWNDRALAIVRAAHNARREASILEDRAGLLVRASRFEDAEAVFLQARTVAEKTGDPYTQALVLSSLGALHMLRGRYGTAARDLEQSLEFFQKVHEPFVEAPVWLTLAEVYMLMDADASAGATLQRGAVLAKKSDFHVAETLMTVLETALKTTDLPDRMDILTKGLASIAASPEGRPLMFGQGIERLLAAAAGFRADGVPTIPIPDAGSVIAPGIPVLPLFGYFIQGRSLLQSGKPKAAREVWTKALAGNPSRDLRAALLAGIGTSYWNEGNADAATESFSRAADALESGLGDIHVEELLTSYLGGYRRVYFEILIEMLLRNGKVETAFGVAERARARAFLQLVGNHRPRPGRATDSALIAEGDSLRTQIANWEQKSAHAHTATIDDELRNGRARYESVMERVKAANPEYASITRVEPLTIDAVRSGLPPDTTMISYFVTPHAVHAWVLERTTFEHIQLPVEPAGLQRAVCWTDHLGRRAGVRGARPEKSLCDQPPGAEEVYTMLVAPLRDHIHNTRLIIVPHGVLHYIPFAALRNPKSGRYLVQDYTITYAPSASTLPFLRSKESPVQGTALVLGDPDGRLPKLEGAKQEALAVAHSLGTTAKIGPQATEELLFQLHGGVDLLHIAAHGHYDGANPMFSYLDLTPANGRDGRLEVHEVLSELDLSGVNLVVLSACETALGKQSGGDEIVGLTRAFLYAGTPGLISTLWDIGDEATGTLMGHFYAKLTAGESAAEALRHAQLAMLQSKSEMDRDPSSWAAFALSGDPQGRWHAAQGIPTPAH